MYNDTLGFYMRSYAVLRDCAVCLPQHAQTHPFCSEEVVLTGEFVPERRSPQLTRRMEIFVKVSPRGKNFPIAKRRSNISHYSHTDCCVMATADWNNSNTQGMGILEQCEQWMEDDDTSFKSICFGTSHWKCQTTTEQANMILEISLKDSKIGQKIIFRVIG